MTLAVTLGLVCLTIEVSVGTLVGLLAWTPAFRRLLEAEFEGDLEVRFHVGGGPFAKKDPRTGQALKTERVFAMSRLMWLLGRLRRIRGSVLDPWRNNAERQLAWRLLAQYEADLDRIGRELEAGNAARMLELAGWPAQVRGYGHVREANAVKAEAERAAALAPVSEAQAA